MINFTETLIFFSVFCTVFHYRPSKAHYGENGRKLWIYITFNYNIVSGVEAESFVRRYS